MPRSNERLQLLLPALIVGLLTLAFIVAKTGRDALFFQGQGLFQLPIAYMAIGVMSLPAAMIFVKVMKVWGARPARVGVLTFAAAVMSAFVPFLRAEATGVLFNLFIFIPAIFAILFASAWLLASDIFEKTPKSEAARFFSRIGASSLAGGMIGGLVSKALAPHLDPKWLILLAAAVIAVVVALVVKTHRVFPSNIVSKKDQSRVKLGFSTVLAKKYARSLLLISMTGALVGLLIDFQFYAAASGAQMGARGNANFFANFYIMLNMGSLLLQLFATPWIQDRVGLRGGLMILPLALIGGATFVTAAATALSRSVLRVTEGGLRSSIHRSIWEQAFIPLESHERSFVKLAVDGIAARVAEALGAAMLFVWLMNAAPDGMPVGELSTNWIAWVTLAVVAVWLIVTNDLRLQAKQEKSEPLPAAPKGPAEIDCERFPDQCPCTTELGKGIA
jgi:AAA family ATP:ADP antiporter